MAKKPLRIYSWNVNGIRAATGKGLSEWLSGCGGEIVGLQEVRAQPDQIPDEIQRLRRYHQHWQPAERRGYSGVGLLSRRAPDQLETSLGSSRFDIEGRLQIARFGKLVIANGYFPNGNGKDRDNSRIPYKLDWYNALFERVQKLRKSGYRVLVMGDFNTAHRAIDLARPKQNEKTSGFTPIERAELDRWMDAGWVDTFRHFEQGPDHYSWWSQRFGVRAKNIGWRIDYVLASPAAMKFVRSGFIHPHITGSDHCPVGVDVEADIFGQNSQGSGQKRTASKR
ncbi:MAG: exodeoxyribonuclease III [bacterium TMED88]|nr:exodeoxyribonuclease III [Deltaproteobacteria bacterium]OUV31651.1 MAG: exodeoxyribonuclease III [bacterium TMED88]